MLKYAYMVVGYKRLLLSDLFIQACLEKAP